MRYLTLDEVLELHRVLLEQSGGRAGLHNANALDSAVAQPAMTFSGQELYPTLADKAAALGFSLVMNHAFIDGNKRIGHAAMETFLVLNDHEFNASADEQEQVILQLAAGALSREAFTEWVKTHLVPHNASHLLVPQQTPDHGRRTTADDE
jgi:death on curing protein